jgi:hypothetical protein
LPSDAVQITKGALELYYNSDPTGQLVTYSPSITWDDVSKTAKEARARDNKKDTTWDTVVQTTKKAKASYNSKGPLRKLGRSFGDIAPAIVHKLDYAPDQMYIKIVCQSLKFIFDVSSAGPLFWSLKLSRLSGCYPTLRETTENTRVLRKCSRTSQRCPGLRQVL